MEATYAGDDGSELVVRIGDVSRMFDQFLREREVMLVEYEFTTVTTKATQRFTEAIDLETGAMVFHRFQCDENAGNEGTDFRCFDRASLIMGTAGLPGGLGLGPAWAQSARVEDGRLLPLQATAHGAVESQYRILGPAADMQPGCRDVQIESPQLSELVFGYRVPFQVVQGVFSACPGTPVPARFSTAATIPELWSATDAITFSLVELHLGESGDDIPFGARDTEEPSGQTEMLREWSNPRFLYDDSDHVEVSLGELHAYAVREDMDYAAVAARGEVFLLDSMLDTTGGARNQFLLDDYVDTFYERTLLLAAGAGPAREVDFEIAVREHADGRIETSYEIVHAVDRAGLSSLLLERLKTPHADVAFAVTLARQLTGLDAWWSYGHRMAWKEVAVGGDVVPRADDYVVVIRFKDPDAGAGESFAPYTVEIDGGSGALLSIDLPPSEFPFGP